MLAIKSLIETKQIFVFTLFAINELIFKRFEKGKNVTVSMTSQSQIHTIRCAFDALGSQVD